MASLNKLAIRGIRSFDDKNISVIEFFSPVTVIVGHNGSGKTTIVECLKYATTGDQPPNTRGGAFIHDPNMANEKEVKAQVKLRFHAANGIRMLVVRNLSVTKKKNGLTMKTLEGILSTADAEKPGKRGTISTKCAEMDAEMPHLLGVSKAVLDNVIFCHQEDSYWPLAEASVLKKKFDDIFEATRYTKALDSIKNLRKERVAEQKVEKERLESLSKEKTHADKLLRRINDLSSEITTKELQYEEAYKEYSAKSNENVKFASDATSFKAVYSQLEQLDKRRQSLMTDIEEIKVDLTEIPATDEELESRIKNFDKELEGHNRKPRQAQEELQDEEDSINNLRASHTKLVGEQLVLQNQAKTYNEELKTRTKFIQEIASEYNIRGYDQSPIDTPQADAFLTQLRVTQEKQNRETEALQKDNHTKIQDYRSKIADLRVEFESIRFRKDNLRGQISDMQEKIAQGEAQIDGAQTLIGELQIVTADIGDKKERLAKLQEEFNAGKYEAKTEEKAKVVRDLEDKKNALNEEFRMLNLQADSRAKLGIKRGEVRMKSQEINNVLQAHNAKFRNLLGVDPKPEKLEREVEQAILQKDQECKDAEEKQNGANKDLQTIAATVSNIKNQLIQKRNELKGAEKKIRLEVGGAESVSDAIKEATNEISVRKEGISSSSVYENLLNEGKTKKVCTVCNRHLSASEMQVFEKYLRDQIRKTSEANIDEINAELEEWEKELSRLESLLPFETTCSRLKQTEIPHLERQLNEQEALLPEATSAAERATEELEAIRRQQKDLAMLKQYATNISRLLKDIEVLNREITALEAELAATGTTKSPEDVQREIDEISSEVRQIERERSNISKERERVLGLLRTIESELMRRQIEESKLQNKLKDKDTTESQLASNQIKLAEMQASSKNLDSQFLVAQRPVKAMEDELAQYESNFQVKLSGAQNKSQCLNRNVDRLEQIQQIIRGRERQRIARKLEECNEEVEKMEAQVTVTSKQIEGLRIKVSGIEKEINSHGSLQANLRENARFRRLKKQVLEVDKEVSGLNLERAGKAKINFEAEMKERRAKEEELKTRYSMLSGEITSMKRQLEEYRKDHAEFKGITKRYTDQLVKVKMADMANADLEKYAKALDNAIMKYHSLKMEEVNDTMRHLWNRTYQGTDIDGIKIVADNEGSATRRTYNYRVVMTKDQVEMDMRGRCSAGQKMLASIIIRLALSDSFGQNCGILALDEPTNALDTENIEALAQSLVDIINERKNHANFQLIIITHDENFLRILGTSGVIQNYWRVSRDSRQKSVIELERLG